MTTGTPPQPTFRSIFAGIAIVLLIFLGFLSLSNLVKYVGAALTFIPGKLGLIHVVSSNEVMPVDMSTSPTKLTFTKPGRYSFFTDNYDLLVINDAIIESKGKPWLKIFTESKDEIEITLIERGLAIFDTPLAKGRPAATFEITEPGMYTMNHPTRPMVAYIVPDYTTGRENWIVFLMISQIMVIVWIVRDIWASRNAKKNSDKN